jgi:hypothetical protein
MDINDWCKYIHKEVKKKGFYNPVPDSSKIHLNIISEVIEASEEVRNGKPPLYTYPLTGLLSNETEYKRVLEGKKGKPEGEAVELADALIRIMDYFGYKNWDLEAIMKLKMAYNKTREYRHGNKKY